MILQKLAIFTLGLALLCGANGVNAQPCCLDYDYPAELLYCGLHFPVYGDYLYWKVGRSDLSYTDDLNNVYYLNPRYQSGWRAGFRAAQGNMDIGARYTSYFFSETIYPGGDNFPENAHISYETDWQIADFEAGYTFCFDCCRLFLRPFAGVKLAWLDETLAKQLENFRQVELSFKGCGLYTGFEAHLPIQELNICCFCLPVALKSRLSAAVLNTRFRRDRCFHEDCFYSPVLEALAGLEFGGCKFWGVTPYILIGYEAQNWLTKGFFSIEETASLSIGGLVARLTLDY